MRVHELPGDLVASLVYRDGALVLMCYRGVRHASEDVAARIARGEDVEPDRYSLRTTPFFETSDTRHTWLNQVVAVGVGDRRPGGVSRVASLSPPRSR